MDLGWMFWSFIGVILERDVSQTHCTDESSSLLV